MALNIDAWVHDLDPFLIQFSETFGIRWYGLAYLSGFLAGYWIISMMTRKGQSPLATPKVGDLITYFVVGVLAGGRLGYCLFYNPELLVDFRPEFPFWGALAVWEGGMASHGGFIGVAVACLLFAHRHKINARHIGDLAILGASIGIFFGRIANFINGELMGRVVEKPIAWAVKFPQDMHRWLSTSDIGEWRQHFQPKLAALTDTAEKLGIQPEQWRSWVDQYLTNGSARSAVYETVDRIIAAVQSQNEAVTAALAQVLEPRHPSQIYAAISEGLIPFLVILWFWRKPRKPGLISGLFLTLYPISRIINEAFRLPDAHIGYQLFGLTRGQWLSIGMFLVAAAYLVWSARQNGPALGGWGTQAESATSSTKSKKN